MSKILSIIKTADQLTRFRDDLGKLQEYVYKTDDSFEQYLSGEMDMDIARVVSDDISKTDKKKILEQYESDLERTLPVKIIVAQQLSSKFIETLSSYAKSIIGEAAILDIIVNKRILAGAVVEYDGRVFDNTLNSMFEKDRDKVIKVIKSYYA